jgi:branched-chain amino acid transport system permease protein
VTPILLDASEQFLNGLMYGCFYALVGGGFTILFGVMRKLNLAYGSTIMAGAYLSLIPWYVFGVPIWVVALTSIVGAMGVGFLVELCCFRFLRKGHELAPLMTTIGMLIVIDETIVFATGAAGLQYPSPFGDESLAWGPFLIRTDYLAILGAGVVVFALIFTFIHRTRLGRAMRAVAERPEAAQILGVRLGRINGLTFALTSALAGLIGFLAAASVGAARPELAVWLTGKGLVVMVLGGLGSLPGAILGGLILGVLEFEAMWFLGATYRDIVAFGMLFLVLVVRPTGLMGVRAV